MTDFLTQTDCDAISAAIAEQERRTRAELVTVVAAASDGYRYIPVLWAAIAAMVVPALVYLAGGWTDFVSLYALQVLLFAALAVGLRQAPFRHRLVPRAVRQQRAARLARQQFVAQRLHHTQGRLGVLLFVSVAERYVEILADSGVSEQVPDSQWQAIVARFGEQVASGQVAAGFLQAIAASGELLAAAAPQDGEPADELPNHLVILEADAD